MCGICGVFNSRLKRIPKAAVLNMCNAMEHRGPDDLGLWDTETVLFGHRRLSIIDLTTGHQPILNENGTVAVILNGEIYNYQELREGLLAKGHQFSTASDTEVLVHLYEDEGIGMLERLRGMFAFALWDDTKKHLFCVRDRLGKKPLFYSKSDTHFVFASELGALMSEGSIEKKIDQKALYYYLTYGYIPHPMTIYANVFKVPPAHYLMVNDHTMTIERYWHLDHERDTVTGNEREVQEQFYALLLESTKLRMISDVPLGAFLSGGIDSSCVVALMSRLSAAPIKTFSIGFDDPDYNELKYAKIVARQFGTEHHEFIVKPAMTEILPELVQRFGEPFADSSCVPTYYVSKLTREHVTVALNGDGADESLAGYERYFAAVSAERFYALLKLIPFAAWNKVIEALPSHVDQRTFLSRIRRFLQGARMPLQERYKLWMSAFPMANLRQLVNENYQQGMAGESARDVIMSLFRSDIRRDAVRDLLRVDLQTYLPGDLLVKMDIMSMVNSLEARSPFLDHKVVEFLWALRSNMKLRWGTSKYLLKQTFKHILPKEIITRSKKGFGVPVRQWFKEDLKDYVKATILDTGGFSAAYFNTAYVEQLINDHVSGKYNHDRALWTLLTLELWYRHCFKN
jgi:asparagine synthase (glutamine-hydrolysing)